MMNQARATVAALLVLASPSHAGIGAIVGRAGTYGGGASQPPTQPPPTADAFVVTGAHIRIGPELLLCPHIPGVAMSARSADCKGYPRPNPEGRPPSSYQAVRPQVYLDQLFGKGRTRFATVAPGPNRDDTRLTIYYFITPAAP